MSKLTERKRAEWFFRNLIFAVLILSITSVKSQTPGSFLIDRFSLVTRHNLIYDHADISQVMTVGNGEIAFSADITGLQTFPESYEKTMPLTTMSNWGWHSFPNPNKYKLEDVLRPVNIRGKTEMYPIVGFPYEDDNLASNWLNENPHHFHLGQVGFILLKKDGKEAAIGDLKKINQKLELWGGTIYSKFELEGYPVEVITSINPQEDQLVVSVKSELTKLGQLKVRLRFPYASNQFTGADWKSPEKHQTKLVGESACQGCFQRDLDSTRYFVTVNSGQEIKFQSCEKHCFTIMPNVASNTFSLSFNFSKNHTPKTVASVTQTQKMVKEFWKNYWTKGGVVDFSGSSDPRAAELERRIILSQYFTAIQSSGSLPPQESGLMNNSWNGKFHLEVHWIHAAHFALWGHPEMLEKSLAWYNDFLPKARKLAADHGYKGARWPKMIGPDGRESPNHINPFIIWQQPHIIYMAELCYRAKPDKITLNKYREVVIQTAEFLASYLFFDQLTQKYILGPPVMPPPEIIQYGYDSLKRETRYITWPASETYNPCFELAYWDFGLKTAQKWLERLGLPRNKEWDYILEHLSPLPKVKNPKGQDSLYLHAANSTTLWSNTKLQIQHPSFLMAKGFLPGDKANDRDMLATLQAVMNTWDKNIWGTDFPMMAMTAARLHQPEKTIDALFSPSPNNNYSYMGLNNNWRSYPVYLPSNGFLLSTIALMTAGWDGNNVFLPGFPKDGKWKVRYERVAKLP